jgi:hypothetical protein
VINFAGQMEDLPDLETESEELKEVVDFFEEFVGEDAINNLVYSETTDFFEESTSNGFTTTMEGGIIEKSEGKEMENLRFDSFKKRESNGQNKVIEKKAPPKSRFEKHQDEIISSENCKFFIKFN